jgi:hypothetical protein
VWITAGHGVNETDEGWFVPKVELAATVHLLLQTGRLEIPRSLPEAEVLGRELEAFRVRVTAAGNEELAGVRPANRVAAEYWEKTGVRVGTVARNIG